MKRESGNPIRWDFATSNQSATWNPVIPAQVVESERVRTKTRILSFPLRWWASLGRTISIQPFYPIKFPHWQTGFACVGMTKFQRAVGWGWWLQPTTSPHQRFLGILMVSVFGGNGERITHGVGNRWNVGIAAEAHPYSQPPCPRCTSYARLAFLIAFYAHLRPLKISTVFYQMRKI